MRVAIIFDMEGAGHIGDDFRELYPAFPEYWRSGRQKLTSDVAAAAQGLLDGGATDVVLLNHHGAGPVDWPNIILDALPVGVGPAPEGLGKRGLRDQVDAMLHVGAHARGGSPSFHSHTIAPGMRLRLNDEELLSESHWWAWTGAVPLLGIVGSEALAAERGSLGEVPYLAVQTSSDRRSARPTFERPEDTAAAIRVFAASAARDAKARRSLTPVGPIRLALSIQNGAQAASSLETAGWRQASSTEFTIEARDWRSTDEAIDEAIYAAAAASFAPYAAVFDGLDATSEETALSFPFERRQALDVLLQAWTADATVDWITPESARRWEGRQTGAS